MKMKLFFLAAALMLSPAITAAGADIPFLTGRVTDNAQILTEEMKKSITETLRAHEAATGNQMAILTIPTLDGQSIEEYAVAVFKAWKLGQKGKDNGILLIVVPNDRRLRIEVGYGLEGTLNDGLAGSIIRNNMTPYFKNNDYNSGIQSGVKAIVDVLEGGKLPVMEKNTTQSGNVLSALNIEAPNMSLAEKILFGAFIFGIIGLFTIIGIVTPGVGWFLYLFLIPFWAMFPIVILGTTGALYCLVIYLIVFPVAKLTLKKTDWYNKAQNDLRTKGKASIGGFTFSSGGSESDGSSGSFGSSGSSGFSGGGGSSGGGGASGGW